MRRDNQIGVILGIVILVIIGVFLSTRTSDIETEIPDLILSEEEKQESEIKEVDISKIIKESKITEPEVVSSMEHVSDEVLVKEEPANITQPESQQEEAPVDPPKDDVSLEGKWEGITGEVAEEIVEEEIVEKPELAEKPERIEEAEVAHKFPSEVEAEIPETKQQTTSYSSSSSTDIIYKVKSNDSLFKIARKHYGDEKKWTWIYEANRDSMSDPDALYVGQELLIPNMSIGKESDNALQTPVSKKLNKDISPHVKTHTVKAGDTLYRLAEKYYDDPEVWIKIFEANEDTIEDKSILKEGQILIIPEL